jgi:hypothetical protein
MVTGIWNANEREIVENLVTQFTNGERGTVSDWYLIIDGDFTFRQRSKRILHGNQEF